jgi:hypothetical protein
MFASILLAAAITLPADYSIGEALKANKAVAGCVSQQAVVLGRDNTEPARDIVVAANSACAEAWSRAALASREAALELQQAELMPPGPAWAPPDPAYQTAVAERKAAFVPAESSAFRAQIDGQATLALLRARSERPHLRRK